MAWPFIVANASVPLLGVVDTAVIGNTGSVIDLGAIALGALIFSFVYWSFGFLRMGTTGFVAQAKGAGDQEEVRAVFGRAGLIALVVGISLLLLQLPIGAISFSLLSGEKAVESVASTYFFTRIWGAPATLIIFVIMGVWIGLGESRELLKLQLFLNGSNMVLDVIAAGVLGLGAQGIAIGTVIAEVSTCVLGFYRLRAHLAHVRNSEAGRREFWPWHRIRDMSQMWALINANIDIMIRTLLLVFAFAYFTNEAAKYGVVALAATHIVLQIMAFTAFFLDGFAYVAEAETGQSYGAKDKNLFTAALYKTTVLAGITAATLAALVAIVGGALVELMTDLTEVVVLSKVLLPICAVYVFASFPAFQLDGVFIGTSRTKEMRDASIMSVLVFLLAVWMLSEALGLAGLWWAMVVFVVARALSLWIYFAKVTERFSQAT
ncbi:putative efflux protein, MATE family [gamma proteobacterium HIMB55]|nr:putative efflux protein, MATE family [gamma proteobacterium HIMB55]